MADVVETIKVNRCQDCFQRRVRHDHCYQFVSTAAGIASSGMNHDVLCLAREPKQTVSES